MTLGNLGSTIVKRAYLFLEILLQFFIIADLAANMESRWSLEGDRPRMIAILVIIILVTIINITILFVLAFNNAALEDYKDNTAIYRPIVLFASCLTCSILIQDNSMHVLFDMANPLCWSLSVIYLYQILYWSIPALVQAEGFDREHNNKTNNAHSNTRNNPDRRAEVDYSRGRNHH